MRILIIEDHEGFRQARRFFLLVGGHEVLNFDSAEAAHQQIDDLAPDVAILDVRLPGRGGDDFARDLVRLHPNTRIIFATGEYDHARLKAAVPGALVLQKPLDLDVLKPMLRCLPAAQLPRDGSRALATLT